MSLRLKIMLGAAALLAAAAVWRWVTYDSGIDPDMDADEARILKLERDGDLEGLSAEASNPKVRVARLAMAALGRIGGAEAAEHLAGAMTAKRPEVRAAAASAYAAAVKQSTAPPLARLIREDKTASVRATAASAVGRMYAYDEMDTLLSAMANDEDLSVRRNAQDAAARIFGRRHTYSARADRRTRGAQVAEIKAIWQADRHAISGFHAYKHHRD